MSTIPPSHSQPSREPDLEHLGSYSPWPPAPPLPPPPAPPTQPSTPVDRQPDSPAPRWVTPLVVAAGLALFLGGTLTGWAIAERGHADPETVASRQEATQQLPLPVSGDVLEPVAEVARAVAPSVVQIETVFGLGSGVVMDEDGHILTAAHVITGVDEVRVRLPDGTLVPGQVVGYHPQTDVGVVAIDPRDDLVPAVLGVDAEVQVGQLAVAVGSPFGLDQTVTSGIVSAVDRPVQTEASAVIGMIQTDASINPGNSGGALADRYGRVIGINDAIRTQGGGNEGVGFAIPIDLAATVAERLIAGEEIRTGFLGVAVGDPSDGPPGAVVRDVFPGTPAEEAGLQVGDLITSIDAESVRSMQELRARILTREAGTAVRLEILREGERIEVELVLATNTG